ncbi:MAG: DsrE/DsrF/TusD sulfur relay family protein [Promethearchaeota archaeon]
MEKMDKYNDKDKDKENKPKSVCIIIGSGPYTTERPYTALRFAYTAAINDIDVKIFLFEDAIFAAKKDQNPSNIYKIEDWIKQCLEEENVTIAVCGVCCKARGVKKEELIDGIQVGTMETALEYVMNSDKQLFF